MKILRRTGQPKSGGRAPFTRKLPWLALVFAWSVFLLAPSTGRTAEVKKIRLAYAGWEAGTAIAYVGIDAGIFKEYQLDVEEIFIRDALSGGVQSLIGVDIVVGAGNPVAILEPILSGRDIVFLGSHTSVESYGMGVSDEIASLQDLKKKKIGVSGLGGRSDLIARVILRRAGISVGDVEWVSAGMSPNRVAALSKKLIQGTPINARFVPEMEKLGIKVLEVKEVPILTSLLMTTRSFLKRDEEAGRRFMKGYLAAIRYYLTHRAESIQIIRRYFSGATPDALENMYDTFAAQMAPYPLPNAEAVQSLLDSVASVDPRAKNAKPVELFDLRFLQELKANGFIESLYTEKTSL
jgi:NitT/TauT family transport system substrate-binding protein